MVIWRVNSNKILTDEECIGCNLFKGKDMFRRELIYNV